MAEKDGFHKPTVAEKIFPENIYCDKRLNIIMKFKKIKQNRSILTIQTLIGRHRKEPFIRGEKGCPKLLHIAKIFKKRLQIIDSLQVQSMLMMKVEDQILFFMNTKNKIWI